MAGLEPGQAVVLIDSQFLTIARFAQGVILQVDYERSEAGYSILVEWSEKHNLNGHRRQTWVPERRLKVVE